MPPAHFLGLRAIPLNHTIIPNVIITPLPAKSGHVPNCRIPEPREAAPSAVDESKALRPDCAPSPATAAADLHPETKIHNDPRYVNILKARFREEQGGHEAGHGLVGPT